MRHELILKRPDGSKVKIIAKITVHGLLGSFRYDANVLKCAKGKRTFFPVVDTNDYQYRKQSFPDGREAWASNKMLEFVTAEEILQAKLELWNKLKPTL